MEQRIQLSDNNLTAQVVLAALALFLIVTVAANIQLPLIRDEGVALALLGAVGSLMCMRSTGHEWHIATPNRFTPIFATLGVLALGLIVTALIGIRLPLVPDDRSAFFALSTILILKVGLVHWCRFRGY